jgi:pimeloyl-ACP methyl ester carboxylesterase
MVTIYKNNTGKREIHESYETYIANLGIPFEREFVETRFGRTHVLVTGPKEGKPLFILQGGNCINPMSLTWFTALLNRYRIFAPDTIGHPGFSAENRVSAKDESFALWITDLLGHYNIDRAAFAGPSYGGGIILRLAAYYPEKIACAILFSTAGMILGSKAGMIKRILIPLLVYKFNKSDKQLKKIKDTMSAGSMNQLDSTIIGQIFRNTKLEKEMPKLSTKAELDRFIAPTMIIAGKKDIFFPGNKLIERASEIIPNVQVRKLYDIGHFSDMNTLKQINEDMIAFLEKNYR